MPGLTLPGGRVLVGSSVEAPEPPTFELCGDAPTSGLPLPGGRVLTGRQVCEVDGGAFDAGFDEGFG